MLNLTVTTEAGFAREVGVTCVCHMYRSGRIYEDHWVINIKSKRFLHFRSKWSCGKSDTRGGNTGKDARQIIFSRGGGARETALAWLFCVCVLVFLLCGNQEGVQ